MSYQQYFRIINLLDSLLDLFSADNLHGYYSLDYITQTLLSTFPEKLLPTEENNIIIPTENQNPMHGYYQYLRFRNLVNHARTTLDSGSVLITKRQFNSMELVIRALIRDDKKVVAGITANPNDAQLPHGLYTSVPDQISCLISLLKKTKSQGRRSKNRLLRSAHTPVDSLLGKLQKLQENLPPCAWSDEPDTLWVVHVELDTAAATIQLLLRLLQESIDMNHEKTALRLISGKSLVFCEDPQNTLRVSLVRIKLLPQGAIMPPNSILACSEALSVFMLHHWLVKYMNDSAFLPKLYIPGLKLDNNKPGIIMGKSFENATYPHKAIMTIKSASDNVNGPDLCTPAILEWTHL